MGKPPTTGNNNGTVILASNPGAIQAGIAVAHDAIGSLGAQPVLLLIVLINVVFAGIGGYFLSQLEKTRASLMATTLEIVRSCVLETAPVLPEKDRVDANAERIKALEDALIKERDRPNH